MLFRSVRSPAKGCMTDIATLVGLILNILNIIGFFTEKKEIELPLITPTIEFFSFPQKDPFLWGGVIFYGLTIMMMIFLRILEERKTQPVGRVGAFIGSGFSVIVISPILIYPLFSAFHILLDSHGTFVATSIIFSSIMSGWVLYNFFNR